MEGSRETTGTVIICQTKGSFRPPKEPWWKCVQEWGSGLCWRYSQRVRKLIFLEWCENLWRGRQWWQQKRWICLDPHTESKKAKRWQTRKQKARKRIYHITRRQSILVNPKIQAVESKWPTVRRLCDRWIIPIIWVRKRKEVALCFQHFRATEGGGS